MSGRAGLAKILMRPRPFKTKPSSGNRTPRWNIVRGDTVQVVQRNHPEYGKQGTVQAVLRSKYRVVVEGLNVAPKQIRGDPEKGIKGKTIMKERSMHYSNVNLVDPVTGLPTRVTYSFLEDGSKVRISKRSGATIPKPDILKIKRHRSSVTSEDSDTINDEDVWTTTYQEHPSKWITLKENLKLPKEK